MASGPRILATGALFAACFAAGVLLPRRGASQDMAFDTSGHSARMSAATGQVLRDVSALYVVDHETRRVALYHALNGKDLTFVSARNAQYDLELRGFRDGSPRIVDVRVLRELFRRAVESGEIEIPGQGPRK